MCSKTFVTDYTGQNGSVINYVYRDTFKDLPSVVYHMYVLVSAL